MTGEAARLYITVGSNTGAAVRGLSSLDGSLKKVAGSALKMVGVVGGIGAVTKGIEAAGKVTVQFDKNMRNVNSIAHLNEKQFQSLSKSVRELGAQTAQSPRTLADGLYDLVSSGFDAKESLTILKSSAKAATAGLTDTAVSTKAVAAVLNAYHRPASDAAKVSDDLFQTVNRGVLSFGDLAQNIGDVLPFAAALHVGLKQVGAATATMTKAGVSAPETMTRIKSVMASMIKPSEDLQKSYKLLGVASGDELVKKTGSLQGAVVALSDSVGGNKTKMAALFPDIRALGGALLLTGSNAKSAKADLAAFASDSGVTNKTLAEQSKSVSYQWNKIKAGVESAAIGIGNKFVPSAYKGMTAAQDFVKGMETGKGSGGDFGKEFTKDFDAVKASLATNMPALKQTWSDMKDIGQQVSGFVQSLHIDFGGMIADTIAGRIQALAGGIHAIKALLHGDIGGIFDGLKAGVEGTAKATLAPFEAIATALPAPFKSAISTILGLFSSLLSGASAVVNQMAKIPGVGGAFKGLAEGIQEAADGIDAMRDRITAVPKKIVIDANADKAKAILQEVEGTKLGTKVMKILGDKKDADGKFKELIALGIPAKKARVLADVADALSGIRGVTQALAAIPLRKTVSVEIQQHGTTNFTPLTNSPNGEGGPAGHTPSPAGPNSPGGRGSKGVSSPTDDVVGRKFNFDSVSHGINVPTAHTATAKTPPKVIGNNPVTGKVEYHTAAEWRVIRANATAKKKAKKNRPSIETGLDQPTLEPVEGLPGGEDAFDGTGEFSQSTFTPGIDALAQAWSDRANEAMAGIAVAALNKTDLTGQQRAASRLVDVRTAQYNAAQQSGDPVALAAAAENLKDATDQFDAATKALKDAAEAVRDAQFTADSAAEIMAKVNTPDDTSDDLAAANHSLADALVNYAAAVAAGDTEGIIKWGGAILTLRDSIDGLTSAVTDNTSALLDLTKAQLEIANKAGNISAGELGALKTWIAGITNGQIGGMVGLGRGTPNPLALASR